MYYTRKPAYLTQIRKTYGKTVQVDGFALKAVSPFYLVSVPVEVKYPSQGVNV